MASLFIDWDPVEGHTVQSITLSDASNTMDFDPTPESMAGLVLRIEQGAGLFPKTITWPSNVYWTAGTPPVLSLTAGQVDVIEFVCAKVSEGVYEYYGKVYAISIL